MCLSGNKKYFIEDLCTLSHGDGDRTSPHSFQGKAYSFKYLKSLQRHHGSWDLERKNTQLVVTMVLVRGMSEGLEPRSLSCHKETACEDQDELAR